MGRERERDGEGDIWKMERNTWEGSQASNGDFVQFCFVTGKAFS
jgi:hypothetical protein